MEFNWLLSLKYQSIYFFTKAWIKRKKWGQGSIDLNYLGPGRKTDSSDRIPLQWIAGNLLSSLMMSSSFSFSDQNTDEEGNKATSEKMSQII